MGLGSDTEVGLAEARDSASSHRKLAKAGFDPIAEATGGDVEMVRLLQQWFGCSLTGSTREQSRLFVFGSGGDGKSVFANVLTGVLGDYAKTAT